MKKIVITTGIFSPDIGGPATHLIQLIPFLNEKGVKITVVTFTDGVSGEELTDFGKVIRVSRNQNFLLRVFHYGRAIYTSIPEAGGVYLHDIGNAGLITCLIVGKRIPIITRIGGDFIWEQAFQSGNTTLGYEAYQGKEGEGFALRRKFSNMILRASKAVIVPSIFLKKIAARWEIGDIEKIHVVANAVNMENLQGDKTSTLVQEIEDAKKREKKILVGSGRFVNWKHFEVLIEAVLQIPNVELYLVGDGPEREKYIEHIDDATNIHLIHSLPREDLASVLKVADVFVLPSEGDTFSFVALEAFILGTPLLLAHKAALPDVFGVYEGRGVYFFEDAEELPQMLTSEEVYIPPTQEDITTIMQKYGVKSHFESIYAILNKYFHN